MTKVHHLNCLEIQSPYGRAIGHCLLVEMANKLILIDAGIGLADTKTPYERIGKQLIDIVGFRFNEEWTAAKQIEKLGFSPKNVTDCIISHLDPDHIGGLVDFPNAKVHMAAEEYENFKSGNPRYLCHQLDHGPEIKTYSKSTQTWFDFEARKVDVTPEIYLIPLFGHTLGHCGVALKQESKWLFYIGDAYYLKAELQNPKHPVDELATLRADNNEWRNKTLNKIRNFMGANPEVEVFGYHDFEEFKLFFI
ncbi:MAG: MBL fold metallo-hydrolase [Verrucomicrobia bacterium]|nr:MBL fold metallo-hydrolase [Verrucomicrobiota bacterium]